MRNILSVSIVVGIVELATPSLGRADVVTADGGNAAPVAEPPRPAPEPLELRPCTDALRFSTGCTSVFGLRGSASTVQGPPAREGAGLMAWSEGENYAQGPIMNVHGVHRLALGGGGTGLEGTLLGGFTVGFRIPFSERQGPVFRAGAFGYVQGNDSFYASVLELPRVEVGYQLTYPSVALEVGVSSGAVLTGRQRIGDAYTRQLGSGLEVGGYLSARIPWFRIRAAAVRLPSADELSAPVRVLDASLCALASPLAICLDARVAVTDEIAYSGALVPDARSMYTGLAVGLTADR